MAEPSLYVGWTAAGVTTLGPGRRFAIWLEGCRRRCPGCLAPELQTRRPDSRIPLDEFWNAIADQLPGHAGVTISGGEPFLQAAGLVALLQRLAEASALDVLVYTGRRLAELRCGGAAVRRALGMIDMLIDGPYREDLPNTLLWRGSDNQRLHLLSARAERYRPYVEARYGPRRRLQFATTPASGIHVVGIPERGFAGALQDGLVRRGVIPGGRS